MLHNLILNGKDEDIDELILQLKVKNMPKKKRCGEEKL